MTREEAEQYAETMTYRDAVYNALQGKCIPYRKATLIKLYELLDVLEQEPTDDYFRRMAGVVISQLRTDRDRLEDKLAELEQEPKTGHCKDCKYFEYDSVAKVDGIPLIVAHEICNKWGDGCKTRENGYCFLFEPQESEG